MTLNANSVAFINFSNLENRLNGMIGNTPPSEIVLWNTVDFTKSLLFGLKHSRLLLDQFIGVSAIHFGPYVEYCKVCWNFCKEIPRDRRSAGFSAVGSHLKCISTKKSCLISLIILWTSFNLFLVYWLFALIFSDSNHDRTTWESTAMQICCAYDFSKVGKVFTAKYADSSSKVGNIFDFIGATLVLQI